MKKELILKKVKTFIININKCTIYTSDDNNYLNICLLFNPIFM